MTTTVKQATYNRCVSEGRKLWCQLQLRNRQLVTLKITLAQLSIKACGDDEHSVKQFAGDIGMPWRSLYRYRKLVTTVYNIAPFTKGGTVPYDKLKDNQVAAIQAVIKQPSLGDRTVTDVREMLKREQKKSPEERRLDCYEPHVRYVADTLEDYELDSFDEVLLARIKAHAKRILKALK